MATNCHLALVVIVLFASLASLDAFSRVRKNDEEVGNQCYEDEPWPCKTPGYCIALEYICDGNQECPDGYDEDHKLCRAKQRPPKDAVVSIINKSKRYLVPEVLGDVSVQRAAHLLTVTSGVEDYAQNAKMTDEQKSNLRMLVEGVRDNDRSVLEKLGIPLSSWSDQSWLFEKLLSSGFEV